MGAIRKETPWLPSISSVKCSGVDSLDMVELICDIEEKCDIDFGEPEGITTVGGIVEHIDSLS